MAGISQFTPSFLSIIFCFSSFPIFASLSFPSSIVSSFSSSFFLLVYSYLLSCPHSSKISAFFSDFLLLTFLPPFLFFFVFISVILSVIFSVSFPLSSFRLPSCFPLYQLPLTSFLSFFSIFLPVIDSVFLPVFLSFIFPSFSLSEKNEDNFLPRLRCINPQVTLIRKSQLKIINFQKEK